MSSTWMMIDGKLNPQAMQSLYTQGMAEEVRPILLGTPYAPIAASGPLLARIGDDSQLHEHWRANESPALHAWCLNSSLPALSLVAHWRRRLLLQGPQGRRLWLRYADARVITRGLAHAVFPRGFWHATTSLQLAANQGACSLLPEPDWEEPSTPTMTPHFSLGEQQLALLSPLSRTQEMPT
ncbi:hypothetical protein L861_05085 [Litchfieldella anticariensis FP35 = DSM 16096]|uniref:DUF4123 domain-containing protein n=1 Tax=Litchfieldella anticariensis (strain DSM 16096 / CECT 5854 / CIP 108499 / LMG 22089 / FP35) TaxID=1121939 RepID=S2L198_LITA3|nr:DUF4123 domain-containing protein [Halomonas anticariensis]EPC01414.1 hypothetical protein L861_05085 [Halomonas anticariensis FP35 = DSM 16096]